MHLYDAIRGASCGRSEFDQYLRNEDGVHEVVGRHSGVACLPGASNGMLVAAVKDGVVSHVSDGSGSLSTTRTLCGSRAGVSSLSLHAATAKSNSRP